MSQTILVRNRTSGKLDLRLGGAAKKPSVFAAILDELEALQPLHGYGNSGPTRAKQSCQEFVRPSELEGANAIARYQKPTGAAL